MANATDDADVAATKKVLVLYGGEHVARSPIQDEANCVWVLSGEANGDSQLSYHWRRINCTGRDGMMPPARIAHAQTLYQNRYLYIFGGRAGMEMQEQAMNDLWMLDTETYEWTQVSAAADATAPEPRSFHRMICVGGALYVFGGCGATSGRLADLHRFDLTTAAHPSWKNLGAAPALRGRGGPNLIPLDGDTKLAVIAGFAGEETSDGKVYDLVTKTWMGEDDLTGRLQGLRPRSVSVSCRLPSLGVALIFGGEVDPSHRGHEGAGGFENDLVVLDAKTGALLQTIKASSSSSWPSQRGWADAGSIDNSGGVGQWYMFGGLAGDDEHPVRLNDLWKLEMSVKRQT
jgi:hypothetical protein